MVSLLKKFLSKALPVLAIGAAGVSLAFVKASQNLNGQVANRTTLSTAALNKVEQTPTLEKKSTKQNVESANLNPLAVQQNDPSTAPQPADVYGNFKKYYRESTGYTQAANTNLSGLGSVTAISLSGFLPTTTDGQTISITEIVPVDVNGAVISDYKVVRVNYLGTSVNSTPALAGGSTESNYGLSDNVYTAAPASALIANNIVANVSFSIEIALSAPAVLSEIRIAQVLPAISAGTTVIGSVGVLTTQAAYRLYNYSTPTNLPNNDGSTTSALVFGQTTAPLSWVKFSELGDSSLAYVLVPKVDAITASFWQDKSVMYVTDDKHYIHVTPFANGGKLSVQLTDSSGTPDTTADDAIEDVAFAPTVSESAQVDFLKQVNDTDFWKETLLRLRAIPGNKINDKQLVTAGMLRNLASTTTQSGLFFTIRMNGRDGAVPENSLSNMAALALIGQMSELSFNSAAVPGTTLTPLSFSYHINPFIQQWLAAYAGINRIVFASAGTSNAPRDATNFAITGDFADARWLLSMNRITTLNLTAYLNYQDEQPIDTRMASADWFSEFLSQQISFSRTPSILIPRNSANNNNPAVDTKILSGVITETVNTGISPPFYYYVATTSQYIEYTSIPEPRIYFDPINGLTSNQLLIDDLYVDLFVKNSVPYWNYSQAYRLSGTTKTIIGVEKNEITDFFPKQQRFVTGPFKASLIANGSSASDFTTLDVDKVKNAPYETITTRPDFEILLGAQNYNEVAKKYYINEIPAETVLYNSQIIVVNEVLNSALYYFENQADSSVHLFTDLTSLLKLYSLDRWSTLNINQIIPSNSPRSAYELYKQNGLGQFIDPDINEYPNNQSVMVNKKVVGPDQIEIFESEAYWKLPDGLKPETIRYFDGTSYYGTLDPTMDWTAGVSELKTRDGYRDNIFNTVITPQHFPLTEATISQIPTASINVDNNDVGVILSSGDTFYDTRLDLIKYKVEGADGTKWYTSWDDFVKPSVNNASLKIFTVTREDRRVGDRAPLPVPKNGLVLRKSDGSATFSSVLINGKWRYLMTRAEFETLNYVDKTGAYYDVLTTAKQAIDQALSTVFKSFDESFIEAPDSRQTVAQSFDVLGNTDLVKTGFTVDGQSHAYVVKDGRAYIEPNLFEQINFVVNSVDRSYASSFGQMSTVQQSGAFSAFKKDDSAIIPGFQGVEITPTDGTRRTIEVRGLDGIIRTTDVVGKKIGNTPVYEFSDVAVGAIIKYKGADNRFLANLDYLKDTDGPVSQVLPFSIESLDATRQHLGVTQQSDQQVRTVIAGSVLGGLGFMGAVAGITRVVYLLRRRSK